MNLELGLQCRLPNFSLASPIQYVSSFIWIKMLGGLLTKYADNVGIWEREQNNTVHPKKNNWQEQFNRDKCTHMGKKWEVEAEALMTVSVKKGLGSFHSFFELLIESARHCAGQWGYTAVKRTYCLPLWNWKTIEGDRYESDSFTNKSIFTNCEESNSA